MSFSYDSSFRLQSETAGGATVGFAYDNDDLLTQAGALTVARNSTNGLPQLSTPQQLWRAGERHHGVLGHAHL